MVSTTRRSRQLEESHRTCQRNPPLFDTYDNCWSLMTSTWSSYPSQQLRMIICLPNLEHIPGNWPHTGVKNCSTPPPVETGETAAGCEIAATSSCCSNCSLPVPVKTGGHQSLSETSQPPPATAATALYQGQQPQARGGNHIPYC
jgi:hypothetical protein